MTCEEASRRRKLTTRELSLEDIWHPLIDAILTSIDARFSERSLALGDGVSALSTFVDDRSAIFIEKFIKMYPKQLGHKTANIVAEYRLLRFRLQREDSDNQGKAGYLELENNLPRILLRMNIGVGGQYLKHQYPAYYDALSLAATIPFSSASPERSFSKLKLLKNRIRSVMTDARLCSLMQGYSEQDILAGIDLDGLVTKFASSLPNGTQRRSLISTQP